MNPVERACRVHRLIATIAALALIKATRYNARKCTLQLCFINGALRIFVILRCTGNYYGAQCELDGEVLGVAIGASVAALIIIVLTLVCLVMWR